VALITLAQARWLRDNPEFILYNRGKFGVGFQRCGVLFDDGRFELIEFDGLPSLLDGCLIVGVPCSG
jgi:hypothetical protein